MTDPSPASTTEGSASGTTAAEPGTSTGSTEAAEGGSTRTTSAGSSSRPRPKGKTGRLVVNLLPWAEVIIDGRSHGRVPVDVVLSVGRHQVRLKNPQLGVVNKVVQISAGQTYTLNKW